MILKNVCQISKSENFLEFEFVIYPEERAHLNEFKKVDKEELSEQIKALSYNSKIQREIRYFSLSLERFVTV